MPEPEKSFDVAILGAGLTGCATAYFLAGRGASVALLDRGEIAGGATGRNAGLVLTGLADHYNRVVRGVGRAEAAAIWRATIENGRLVREAVAAHGIACGYEPRGSYALASFPAEAQDLAESFAFLREDGLGAHATLLSQEALAAESGAPRGLAAIRFDDDAGLDAAALARGLATNARGVAILERTEVLSVAAGGDEVRLETSRGEVRATIVVLATNAEAGRLHRFFAPLLWPVRGQGFVTKPLPRLLSRGVTASWGHEWYRQREDGRLVVAGVRPDPSEEEIGTAEVVTATFQGFLERFAAARIPGLEAPLAVESRFASIAAFTQDGLPLAGPVPGVASLVAACGFDMRGLSLGLAIGRAVARLVLDGTREIPASFGPGRFL
jgi:glycine/D-amino acid oxidase-like deaminating enzyme